jgi:hypothetical protein
MTRFLIKRRDFSSPLCGSGILIKVRQRKEANTRTGEFNFLYTFTGVLLWTAADQEKQQRKYRNNIRNIPPREYKYQGKQEL